MHKNKKAQGLSLHTVIIAALAIIVLVVLIYLLVGTTGDTDKALSCTKKGGICMDNCEGIYSRDVGSHGEFCNEQQCCLPGNN